MWLCMEIQIMGEERDKLNGEGLRGKVKRKVD